MAEIIKFPDRADATPWEWLRALADEFEAEGDKTAQMCLVVVNTEGEDFRIRASRFKLTLLETIGMLTTAAHDFNEQG